MTLLSFGGDSKSPKPIYARSGWEIPQPKPIEIGAERQSQKPELVRLRTKTLIDAMTKAGSNLKIRSVSPYMYNCVGMIFANRRAWIDIEQIYDILREDGYNKIPLERVVTGDLVLYTFSNMPSHIGLVTIVHSPLGQIPSIRVLSKWGKDGEIEHHSEDVPSYCGRPSSYWSEKVL